MNRNFEDQYKLGHLKGGSGTKKQEAKIWYFQFLFLSSIRMTIYKRMSLLTHNSQPSTQYSFNIQDFVLIHIYHVIKKYIYFSKRIKRQNMGWSQKIVRSEKVKKHQKLGLSQKASRSKVKFLLTIEIMINSEKTLFLKKV